MNTSILSTEEHVGSQARIHMQGFRVGELLEIGHGPTSRLRSKPLHIWVRRAGACPDPCRSTLALAGGSLIPAPWSSTMHMPHNGR